MGVNFVINLNSQMCKRKAHTVQQYKSLKKLITNALFLLLVYTFIQNILSVEQKRLYYCMRLLKNMSSSFCILKQNNFSVTIFLWHIFTIQFRIFLLSNFSLHRDKTLRVLPHTSDIYEARVIASLRSILAKITFSCMY